MNSSASIKYPFIMDNLPSKGEVVIISDFREKASRNDCWGISFIITDIDSIQPFLHYSKQIKEKYNISNHQIKYNKIKAYEWRPEYVNEFLNAADVIEGIMFTFVVNPNYISVFNISSKINTQNYSIFRPREFQKLELFSNLVGLILSKFEVSLNTLSWITDHDNSTFLLRSRLYGLSSTIRTRSCEAEVSGSSSSISRSETIRTKILQL